MTAAVVRVLKPGGVVVEETLEVVRMAEAGPVARNGLRGALVKFEDGPRWVPADWIVEIA